MSIYLNFLPKRNTEYSLSTTSKILPLQEKPSPVKPGSHRQLASPFSGTEHLPLTSQRLQISGISKTFFFPSK